MIWTESPNLQTEGQLVWYYTSHDHIITPYEEQYRAFFDITPQNYLKNVTIFHGKMGHRIYSQTFHPNTPLSHLPTILTELERIILLTAI